MIVGTGIDLIEVRRIADSLQRFGERFVRRIFTEDEARYCEPALNRAERYAARFAAKEAGMKALGTGWRGVAWRDIEVRRLRSGQPTLVFSGRAAELAEKYGVKRASLSLSHTAQHAIAHVILEN